MRGLLTALAIYISALSPAWATAFTSACGGTTCNWNAGASWTGGTGSNFPNSSGDTATLSANDVLVVPASVSITVGAITKGTGTGITINGTMTWAGAVSGGGAFTLTVNAGGTLDAGNQAFTAGSGRTSYIFAGSPTTCHQTNGTSSNCATVTSTPAGATFSLGTGFTTINATYTDFSNLGTSAFGWSRSTSGINQIFKHNVVTNSGRLDIDNDCNTTNIGFDVQFNDFRNPSPADPIASAAYQPFVQQAAAACPLGTTPRIFANNTFSTSGATGAAYVQARSATISGNVFSAWALFLAPNAGNNSDHTLSGNFFANQSSYDQFFKEAGGFNYFNASTSNYYYYTRGSGSHPFGHLPSALSATLRATGDVLEQSNLAAGTTAWWLWSGLTTSVQLDHELMLSPGGFFVITGPITPPTLAIFNNTTLSNSAGLALAGNDCTGGNAGPYPMLVWAESTGKITAGTSSQVYNNLVLIPDTTQTRGYAIDLVNNTTDQIGLLDYNGGYGYPGGVQSPPVKYSTSCVVVTSGLGPHDISADPIFVDRTRNLAKFDLASGGPGTAANYISEALKANGYGGAFNTVYTPAAPVTYVRAGFVPQSSAYKGTGLSGGDIGALPAVPLPSSGSGLLLMGVN